MVNSIIVALGAVVMGFGYGYFLIGFVWLLCGWWWKSLNIWRAAFILFAFYICGLIFFLVLALTIDLFPDWRSFVQVLAIVWCIAMGFTAFSVVNKHRISSRKNVMPAS
ncbi:hypothetical protein [Croceicoccus sediminis]|uniref:hypothetical protein n=1 Tax=Croceicoccus sediminis TaxID=2571150 RepID=UPI001181CFEA|nr:hypothetical protein [Croceicoccus sediminis]